MLMGACREMSDEREGRGGGEEVEAGLGANFLWAAVFASFLSSCLPPSFRNHIAVNTFNIDIHEILSEMMPLSTGSSQRNGIP